MGTVSDTSSPNLQHLFTTPIIEQVWPEADELNDRLCEVILAKERDSAGESRSNVGGWHSVGDFDQWGGASGETLIGRIGELVNVATARYYKLYGGTEPIRWRITTWANVSRRGDYNRGHVHPGCTWSGVYYVDAGDADANDTDSGLLVLAHPVSAATMTVVPGLTPDYHAFRPVSGLMVVFPSYLTHEVQPYRGNRPRISIAFNIKREPFEQDIAS